MFKKILSLMLVVAMTLSLAFVFTSCAKDENDDNKGEDLANLKVGFICLHDENSTYDKNFLDAIEVAKKDLGLKDDQVIVKTNIPESDECYQAAADLVDQGCNVIFANSFGHETHIIKAAKEFKDVQFCHATGTHAHTEGLANFHNAFASIYEGRFLTGVAAGLKLNELKKDGKLKGEVAKLGYIGAFPYAEVKSGYTAFYLGAKSVCPEVIMDVTFTGAWYDPVKESNAAKNLIGRGCDVISQHADSMGAPSACEEAKVPNISYNGSTVETCPNSFIVSSKINWAPYFEYMVNCVKNNEKIAADWTGTLKTESVQLTAINEKVAAAGTADKIAEVKAKLESGELHVFDVSTFTVGGKNLTSYLADVDDHGDFVKETEAIKNGYFAESELRSAPYFDIDIDGITNIDK